MTQNYRMGWRAAEPASAWTQENGQQSASDVEGALHGWARRGPPRPLEADRAVDQAPCLDADVLDAYRRLGQGWHARINEVLRAHMPSDWH